MSDDFEDARLYLELFYFTVSLINDQNPPIAYFKSDFVVLMQPIITKFVQQFPNPNERNVIISPAYRKLVQTYVSKIKPLIDALKRSGLWIPQGKASASVDPTDLISPVLAAETIDVEQLLLLRAVKINQLLFSPELSLYFNACLHGCLSHIVIIRLYSYSLLRSAPQIVDLRHFFVVMKEAVFLWNSGTVSFEFSAAFYLLLTRFAEHRQSSNDKNEYQLILQMIEDLHNSSNFETLMCFEPSLNWMFSTFSSEMIQNVYNSSLNSLKNGHSGDFSIICHCLSSGIGDPSIFYNATEAAFSSVPMWAYPIQKETRARLANLPLCCPEAVTPKIIDLIAKQLKMSKEISTPCLYIFADFLVSYYLGTSAPLNISLIEALLDMVAGSESKRNLPLDIQAIIAAICSSPIRLLSILPSSIQKQQLFSLIALNKPDFQWTNSLLLYLSSPQTFPLFSNSEVKAAVKRAKEKPFSNEEKEEECYSVRINLELPLLLSLYPGEFRKLAEELKNFIDEDFKYVIIEIFAIIAIMGRAQSDCISMMDMLPKISYQCEYSELIPLIKTACGLMDQVTNGSNTKKEIANQESINDKGNKDVLEKLQKHLDPSMSQFMVVGSASSTAAAFLFEHVVWSEGGEPDIIFKRLRLKPALWFANVCASLFISIVANPEGSLTNLLDEYAKTSADHLIYIGYILFKRIIPSLKRILVTESFRELPKHLFYPLIPFDVQPEEKNEIENLAKKYQNVLKDIFKVTVQSKGY